MSNEDPTKVATSLAYENVEKVDAGRLPGPGSGANQNNKSRSTLIAKNIVVNGRRTSVRMEPEVWKAIDEIAERGRLDRNHMFTVVANRLKPHQSLTSAMRVFVINYYRDSSTESGHVRAGHGPRRHGG